MAGTKFEFPRAERLNQRAAFDAAFALRASASDARLIVYAVPNGLTIRRLGLRVGRRFGNAPQRNRFKRLIREAYRLHREKLPPGWDLVVTPRPIKPEPSAKPKKGTRPAAAPPAPPARRPVLADVAPAFVELALAAIRRAERKGATPPAQS
jgi:ribonuclease P protein component